MNLKTSFDFDAAHRLVGYEGKCSNLHGHIWHVDLEIDGDGLDKVGMLWDFTHAKELKDLFDHKTILWNCEDNKLLIKTITEVCGRDSVYLMNCNPTAENLCEEILQALVYTNPSFLYRVTVYESPKSSAESVR